MKILRSIIVLFVIFLLLPITVFAKSDYKDILGPKINYESDKVTIYLFYMDGCSHCAAEKVFLKELSDKYPDLNVVYYDVYTYDNYYQEAQKLFDLNINSVPFTIVGEEYYLGFSKGGLVEENITDQIKHYFSDSEHKDDFTKKYSIPLLGNINPKKASIPLVAIILGLIDGFNPCAMWVLLFLLTILINAKDRKKMLIIGSIFLFTSGLIYYLSILGINIILGIKIVTNYEESIKELGWYIIGYPIVSIIALIIIVNIPYDWYSYAFFFITVGIDYFYYGYLRNVLSKS